jgi:hypothetical protein
MAHLWVNRNVRTIMAVSAVVSLVAHSAVITGWVLGTMPAPGVDVPDGSIANRVFYIPPPDRVGGRVGTREVIRYIRTADQGGTGAGEGSRTAGNKAPTTVDESVSQASDVFTDTTVSEAVPESVSESSIYTILDVDTAVVRSASSAAPAYPPRLLAAKIQGYVNAEYVVDTTGLADTLSFRVLAETHPDFTRAVRNVLPLMRFQPAKIGPMKVRQLVQQQFSFRITDTDTSEAFPVRPDA